MIPIVLNMLKKQPIIPIVAVGGVGYGVYYLWKNFNPFAMVGKGLSGVTSAARGAYKRTTKGVFGAGKSAYKGVTAMPKNIFSFGKKNKKYVPAVAVFKAGKALAKSPQAKAVAKAASKKAKSYQKKARKSSKKAKKYLKRLKW